MCNIVSNAAQHTLGWYRARLGNITGSNVGLIMKKGKSKEFSDTAESYLYDVASDRTLNPSIVESDELFEEFLKVTSATSKAMAWGNEQEPNARELYSKITGRKMVEVGSCKHPKIPFFASSPDGFYYNEESGERICLEIKCLGKKEYIKYLHLVKDGESLLKVNPQYYYQCHAHMMVTQSIATDFVIYNPFQDIPMRIVRIYWNEDVARNIAERVGLANIFINSIIENRTIDRTA